MSHFAATIVAMEEKPRTTPYPLRMTDELRSKLEASAKAGSRSLHAEIVARLEQSLANEAEARLEQTFKGKRKSAAPTAGTSYVQPLLLNQLNGQIRLQLAIAALESQARISLKKLNKVRASIDQIEAVIIKAEAEDDAEKARAMESRLSDEINWMREVEIEYISTIEEITELKRELNAMQSQIDDHFQLGA